MPPKLAICNNWAAVPLPAAILELKPTWTEFSVTALAQVAVKFDVNGKDMRQLRSHALVFANQTPAVNMVPRNLAPNEFFVLFAKFSDEEVAIRKKKILLVRRVVTDKLIGLYAEGIQGAYKETIPNEHFYPDGADEIVLEHLCHNDGVDSNVIRKAQESFSRPGQCVHPDEVEIKTAAFLGAPQQRKQVIQRDSGTDLTPTFLVTRSNQCLDTRSKEYELYGFPHLHSNGLATVYDPMRMVKVSPAQARKHLLRLEMRAFAQDPLWTLVNFDNSNKDRSQGLLTARLKHSPYLANAAFHVKEEDLQAQLQFQNDERKAVLAGADFRNTSSHRNAQHVLGHVKSIETVVRGSDAEREDMRHQMYGFTYQIGLPHAMISFTPSSYANGMVAIISSGGDATLFGSGEKEFTVDLSDVRTVELTSRIQESASSDPAACAEYFLEITNHLFREVLKLDTDKRTAEHGYLGTIEWCGGGIENQGSQLLHLHVCVRFREWPAWLVRLKTLSSSSEKIDTPTTKAMPEKVMETEPENALSHIENEIGDPNELTDAVNHTENEFKDPTELTDAQKIALVDNICKATFPVLRFFQRGEYSAVRCPGCGLFDLEEIPLTIFHKSDRVEQHPYIAHCPACEQQFTSLSLRSKCIRRVIDMLANDFDPYLEASRQRLSCWSEFCFPIENFEFLEIVRKNLVFDMDHDALLPMSDACIKYVQEVLSFTVLLSIVQEHAVLHMQSCFSKGKKRGMNCQLCRYDKPNEVQATTDFIDSTKSEIAPKRLLGCSYLNAYVAPFLILGKSNHDLRFLRENSIEYSVKYTSKPQGTINEEKATCAIREGITRAFRSTDFKIARDPEMTVSEIGETRTRSLVYNLTNWMRVDSTLIGFFLLTDDRPMISSHRVVRLSLYPILAMILDREVTVTLVRKKNGGAVASMAITNYLKRKNRDLSLFEFLIRYGGRNPSSKRRKPGKERTRTTGDIVDDEAAEVNDSSDSDNEQETNGSEANIDSNKDNEGSIGCPSSLHDYIVILKGSTLRPEARRNTEKKIEEHALAALVCFVSFESATSACIKGDHATYHEAFKAAELTGRICKVGVKYLNNMEHLWALKIKSQQHTKAHIENLKKKVNAIPELNQPKRRPHNGTEADDSDDDVNFHSQSDSETSDVELFEGHSSTLFPSHKGPLRIS